MNSPDTTFQFSSFSGVPFFQDQRRKIGLLYRSSRTARAAMIGFALISQLVALLLIGFVGILLGAGIRILFAH